MTSLARSLKAMLLALCAVGVHAEAQLRAGSVATEALLKDVIVGYYDAIGENRPAEAVRFYHSDSPEVAGIRTEIELEQAAYLQITATLSFDFISQRQDLAFGKARHRFLRIAGVKFFEEFADVAYVFRKENGAWKLWVTRTKTSRPEDRNDVTVKGKPE